MEPGWHPKSAASLRTVASVDPRPETVEDVLNVCPQQASTFGGRHLRLAWICSPADETQGWPGRNGVARVRVDTALRPQDPAVLLVSGSAGPSRDPVVDLRVSAIPPHFVQPWASVEIVRGSGACGGVGKWPGGGDRQPGVGGGGGVGGGSSSGGGEPDDSALTGLRPESALELLRGSVVRTGGVVHLLATPTDVTCRGVTLLCRRAPEYTIPAVAPAAAAAGGGGGRGSGGSAKGKDKSGSGRPRNANAARKRVGEGEGGTSAGERQGARRATGGGASSRAGGATTHNIGAKERVDRDGKDGEEGKDGSHRRHARHSAPSVNAAVGSRSESFVGGGSGGAREGGKDDEASAKGGDWAGMLADWGVVTTLSEVVVPHKALEVWYHDDAPDTSSEGEPDWVEAVLRSHAPSVLDDISAALQLSPSATGVGSALWVSAEEAEGEREDGVGAGGGALLVHGPPGVGKTRLVEALARRLRCRLVKVSPGRLAAAAGVEADRVLSEAFRYCRQCASHRVLLLLDSMDRLIPASEGSVGASRGDVDAGVLNALVLEVEQGRRDTSRRGLVAIVGVTSWPDQVHPTARRCAGQEVVVLPPSQPLRGEILRRALLQAGWKMQAWEVEEGGKGSPELQEAFAEVVGLCQGFTAGDMCAVAATAVDLAASRPPQHRGFKAVAGEEFLHSHGEALRAGFRQVRRRVIAGRGGAGGGGDGGSAAVSGVPSVRWTEVGGLERAKSAVQEMVVWPARFPETFSRMGISPASGILLFGPPGTGKTLLAKAAATETGATFIELKISDVVRGEVGESEKAVDRAFRTARELAPSIIFIDEFQALFASRDASGGTGSRLASQLLVCMDELARWRAAGLRGSGRPGNGRRRDDESSLGGLPGCVDGSDGSTEAASPATTTAEQKEGSAARGAVQSASANVMVLAATNAPGAVDAAFLRPGRFDEIVYAGLPDLQGRQHILRAAKARMEAMSSPEVSPSPTTTTALISSADTTSCKTLPATRIEPDASTPASAAAAAAAAAASTHASSELPEGAESRHAHAHGNSTGDGYRGGRWASDVDTAWLSRQTEGYSGADLSSLVRNAAMASLRAQGDGSREGKGGRCRVSSGGSDSGAATAFLVLARRHFETALASTRPSSGPEVVARHESWARQWHVA